MQNERLVTVHDSHCDQPDANFPPTPYVNRSDCDRTGI